MTEYYLHIGLHKTGTKFFQHKLFPNMLAEECYYNPDTLSQLICDLIKAETEDKHLVYEAIEHEKSKLEEQGVKKVLISREIMAGDLFTMYTNHKTHYSILFNAFPNAKIICFLRYQLDWITSCYRETIHEHHYQSIEQFLSLKNGENKFVKTQYTTLDWAGIVSTLNETFGEENVSLFFFEDFKTNKNEVIREISNIIGIQEIKPTLDNDPIPNRGYSAFSIRLSLLRYRISRLTSFIGLKVHRPITFFGKNGIPAGSEKLSVLSKEKYWHANYLRDNEEVRSRNYPDNLTLSERLQLKFSWRYIIKQKIDKWFYWDWDILKKNRTEMDTYFKNENRKLVELVPNKKIPIDYLD